MDEEKYMLTAKEYYTLYCKAFSQLDKIATMAEKALQDLEELQLKMGDRFDTENASEDA